VVVSHQPAWRANFEVFNSDGTKKFPCKRCVRFFVLSFYTQCGCEKTDDGRFGGPVITPAPLADRNAAEGRERRGQGESEKAGHLKSPPRRL
jgi:hypothetical protein